MPLSLKEVMEKVALKQKKNPNKEVTRPWQSESILYQKEQSKDNKATTKCQQSDNETNNKLTTKCQQSDNETNNKLTTK
jgi:hypothetical protein